MINGEKIILRPFKKTDRKFTYQLRINLEIINSLLSYPLPVSDDVEGEWIKGIIEKKKSDQAYFAITSHDSNDFLGYCSLKNIDYRNGNAEYGIVILPEHQGKGYASEATKLISIYGIDTLRLNKIFCYIRSDNESSITMFKKAGYYLEGILKKHVFRNNRYIDVAIYAFLKKMK